MKIRIRKVDKMFADYLKAKVGYRCERCKKQYQKGDRAIQLSHFHGRRKESTRFEENNCSILCFSCHNRFHEQPLEHTEWMKKRLGRKRFDLLTLQANTPKKKDDKMIEIYLNKLLETL